MDKKKYDFGGWATRFGIKCSDGRTICKGAFKGNDGVEVPLVWNHGHNDVSNVLGHALLEERDEGVYAYCCFNDTENGQIGKKLVTHGDICALSIYANQLKQNGNSVIHGCIREVSLVLAGANPGAFINNVVLHSEDGNTLLNANGEAMVDEETAEIFHGYKGLEIPDNQNTQTSEGEQQMGNETNPPVVHAEGETTKNEKTVAEVFDELTDEQKAVVYALIGQALEQAGEEQPEGTKMKHNAFDGETDNQDLTLAHAEVLSAINDVIKTKKYNTMKESFLAHGITNIGELFPEFQNVTKTPKTVDIENDWVAVVMNGVKHTPFSRIKSTYATLTGAEARARGYAKGNKKVEEVLIAAKRTTDPQTVYKLQKMDRDDVIDITDFDVIAWLKGEMREKLDQEIARAILVGDGRDALSNDKISEDHIRSIANDVSTYTIKRTLGQVGSTVAQIAALLVDDAVVAQEDYKGSGNITQFVRRDVLSQMLLLKDLNGHRIYKDAKELATAMMVNRIVPVPASVMGKNYAIMVDLSDYNVGADKGGAVNMFDDFDIDYNKYEYLIETRCSGANVTPFSAIAFVEAEEEEDEEEEAGE